MTASRLLTVLALCATIMCLHVGSATAQTPSVASLADSSAALERPSVSATGPRWNTLSVAVQTHNAAPQSISPLAASSMGHQQSTALIIVGGVGILVGAIIGGTPGTVFMVGGAVVGLYGLYEYLQ